jgi:hypothetical protein
MEREPILWMGTDRMIPRYVYVNYFTYFLADVNGNMVSGPRENMG